jgi:hypothetical protein
MEHRVIRAGYVVLGPPFRPEVVIQLGGAFGIDGGPFRIREELPPGILRRSL